MHKSVCKPSQEMPNCMLRPFNSMHRAPQNLVSPLPTHHILPNTSHYPSKKVQGTRSHTSSNSPTLWRPQISNFYRREEIGFWERNPQWQFGQYSLTGLPLCCRAVWMVRKAPPLRPMLPVLANLNSLPSERSMLPQFKTLLLVQHVEFHFQKP